MRFTAIAVLLLASSFANGDPGGQGRGNGWGRGGGKPEGRGNGGYSNGCPFSGITYEEEMIAELEYDAAEKTEEAIESLETLEIKEHGGFRGTKPEGFRMNDRGPGSESGSDGGRSNEFSEGSSLSFEDPDETQASYATHQRRIQLREENGRVSCQG